jgi:fructose-1,6-bisphosphatase/sedoheptulose 1,7-bisphosphatase-like protein
MGEALAALLHDYITTSGFGSCVHSPEHEWMPWCEDMANRERARHAALVEAARSQHRRVENVTQDGDDWTGCVCGEADDGCAVLAALGGKPPETCCYALDAERARHAALVEAARNVAALWDDDDINPTISAWTAANDAFLALRAALDGELR